MPDVTSPGVPVDDLAATLTKLGFQAANPGPRVEESARLSRRLRRTTWSAPSMRTRVSVTVVHGSQDPTDTTLGEAFDELHRVVALLNRHDGSSAVSTLNERGALRGAPPELRAVLNGAAELHRISRGAFDVTVKPVVDLLRGLKFGGAVSDAELRSARGLVGMSGLRVGRRSVRLKRSGMGLTLDGIAKGYVVDCVAAVLQRRGLDRWLIDAGGDIRTSGLNEDDRPWRIGVQDPLRQTGFPVVTELTTGAIATSGGYEDRFTPDGRVHHVVDTATGRSPQTTLSASVAAPSAMMADALATTTLVLRPAWAVALIETLPCCACLLLGADGRRWRSSRWRSVSESHRERGEP
ncbi:MAG: FAD:protein FMN transferase [Gemmatimonadetes bacterium]|nr:FAD:protein FMN transferase [Gemmatimonadota bacterium]